MEREFDIPLVSTIGERCRACYACVRECPAKAIRIAGGRAEVIAARCIGCGNCVRVCSQNAKAVRSGVAPVELLLASDARVAACLAPSYPAEFSDLDPERLAGALRALGFAMVNEVAFGADLVAHRYRKLLEESGDRRHIATTCPAVIAYIERYHPELVPSLAPIVSPMVATARALRALHGPQLRVVFIGPCIAKKDECCPEAAQPEIDAVLTFGELRELWRRRGLDPAAAAASDWDRPRGGLGGLFPVSRGMLQAARLPEDLLSGRVVAAEGRASFLEAIKEFAHGDLRARLLEVLCCNGCIAGAGMSRPEALFTRRARVGRHVQQRQQQLDQAQWRADLAHFASLDLGRGFAADDQRTPLPDAEQLRQALSRMGKEQPTDELNCGACGYDTCLEHAVAICNGLAENEMCLPYTIDQLRRTVSDLGLTNQQLSSAREALAHSEKMASLGQLAAGIAHEVNNPLGVVLMYAHLARDACAEGDELREDLALIAQQADRCKKIVAGLLHFARQNKVERRQADVRALLADCARALPPPLGVEVRIEHENGAEPTAAIDRDQIAQVLTNLIVNAYDALPDGGAVVLGVGGDGESVRLRVADNGPGIPAEHLGRIFEPFFTTKRPGKGTGLGLAVSYGIVKMHHGDIRVESNTDPAAGPTGAVFTVTLPRCAPEERP